MSRRGGRPMRSRGGLKAAKGSTTMSSARKETAPAAEAGEELECLTCTEVMTYFADCKCKHRVVCARCSIKMRAFSHQFDCIICKEDQQAIVVSCDQSKSFEDYNLGVLQYRSDEKGGKHRTYFADEKAQTLVKEALGYTCAKCGSEFTSMRLLKSHLREAHGLQFCTVCVENLKMFLSEQKLFTRSELKRHIQGTTGEDGQQIGGHPYCEFCGKPFLDSDILWQHMEKEHVACHICARQEEMYRYFENYKALEEHFDTDHYLCPHAMCREQRHIVFATALDLKAHNISVHLSARNMSQSEKKKAYSLDLWTNDGPLRSSQERETRSRRGGRSEGGNRGRRDGRQNGHHHQQSSPPPAETQERKYAEEAREDADDVVLHVPRTKEELRERNRQVMVSVKEALAGVPNGLDKLKVLSRDFKNGRLSAAEYHKKFLALFGTTNGIPVYLDLAALLPDVKQRSDLLQAHLDWKDVRQNFPQVGSEPHQSSSSSLGPSAAGAAVSAASPSPPADTSSAAEFPSLGGGGGGGGPGAPPGLSLAGAAVYANRGRPTAAEFPALASSAPGTIAGSSGPIISQPSVADWGASVPEDSGGGKKRRKKKNQKVTLFSTGIRYS